MNGKRLRNVLISGVTGLLMLGVLWLLTRSYSIADLPTPSGNLKPLTAWTDELAVKNNELPTGWKVDAWTWEDYWGTQARTFGYKYPAALGQPGLTLKEEVILYSTTLLAKQGYLHVLDTYFPPTAKDKWKAVPELTISNHADEMKTACFQGGINGIPQLLCSAIGRYQNVIVAVHGNVFTNQWLTLADYRYMLEAVDKRVTIILSK